MRVSPPDGREKPAAGNGNGNGSGDNSPHSSSNQSAPLYPGPPGVHGDLVRLQANVFGLVVNPQLEEVRRYDVTIMSSDRVDVQDFQDQDVRPDWITKKTANDHYSVERKVKAFKIMAQFMKANRALFQDVQSSYDGQAIMFCTKALPYEGPRFQYFLKPADDDPIEGVAIAEICLQEVATGALSMDAYRRVAQDPETIDADKSLCQYMQIMLMNGAMQNDQFLCFEKGKIYFKEPNGSNIANEFIELPDGKELKPGIKMSVQIVEGPRGRDRANFAVAIDAKKAAFHKAQPLAVKAMAVLNGFRFNQGCDEAQLDRLNQVLRGLMIETTHTTKKKAYKIIGFKHNANYEMVVADKKISVGNYYKEKYNVELRAPLAPLVIVQSKKETFFPLEICNATPYQRVTVPQQTPEQMRFTTKECALPPIRRQRLIVAGIQKVEMNDMEVERRRTGGVQMVKNPLLFNGRVLPPPTSCNYNNGHQSQIMANGTWVASRGSRYLACGKMPKWALLTVNCRDPMVCKTGVQNIVRDARQRGIDIPDPSIMESIMAGKLEEFFHYAKENHVEYIFTVCDDSISTQDMLKSYERKYEIMTQNIKARTAGACAEGKRTTIENIVNKMNMKLGGTNYTVKINGSNCLEKGEVLVIGIGVMSPPPGVVLDYQENIKMPSVVGYSANTSAKRPETFIGDFIMVDSGNIDAQLIGDKVVKTVIESWIAMKKEVGAERLMPKHIVIYRSGLPDGEFFKLHKNELPAIKQIIRGYDVEPQTTLTYVVATKDHAVRIFAHEQTSMTAKPSEQNIKVGTVVDQCITSPKYRQFYLNSHVALQGSAQTPLYTVLTDESGWHADQFQQMTHHLCFLHQIVNMPTSLPSPLYIANRYADRGRRLAMEDYKTEARHGPVHFDMNKMQERIGYVGSKFEKVRVNA